MTKRVAAIMGTLVLGWAGSARAADPLLPPAAAPGGVVTQPMPVVIPPAAADMKVPQPMPAGTPGGAVAAPAEKGPFWQSSWGDHAPVWDSPVDVIGGHVVAGTGAYLIHPNFESNPAYGAARMVTVGSATTRQEIQQDFRYDLQPAFLTWLGYVTESGLGGRIRWWQFDHSTQEVLINDGTASVTSAAPLGIGLSSTAPGDVLVFRSDLKFTVWDFEGTQALKAGCWDLLFAAGMRYLWIVQDYSATASNPASAVREVVASAHNFDGVGPTVAVEGRFHVGDTGLAFYSMGRASAPFGKSHGEAFHVIQVAGVPTITEDNAANRYTLLPITELEVGGEYGMDLGPTRVFAQAAVVGQAWFGGGNAANVDSTFTNGSNSSTTFGLIGMVFRAGVTY